MSRPKRICVTQDEKEELRDVKMELYGESVAGDVPFAVAITDLIEFYREENK